MKRTDGPFLIYEILPGQLYQRGKLHKLAVGVKEAGLAHYGIGHAVQMAPPMPDPHLADLLDYVHYPIPDSKLRDHDKDTLKLMAMQYSIIISAGGRVLTMCNAGRNRSGLLSALIVRQLTGLPGYAAMQIVREQRPNALANPYFEAYLEELE